MTEPTELMPCPFCGGINIIHCCHHMYCHACGADGPDADSQCESEAIAAWNTRTPQPTQAQAGAVPLTDNELVRRSRVGAIQTDEKGKVVMWPAYYRTQMEDRFKRGWREAEKHYGIKGGQHGL